MNVSDLKHNSGPAVSRYVAKPSSHNENNSGNRGGVKNDALVPQKDTDTLFLNNIRPEKAREFLQSRISRSISESIPQPQEKPTSNARANRPDFARNFPSADVTASYIIDDIAQAAKTIQSPPAAVGNATQENQTSNLSDLINKIQDGFQQAREALNQLGALSPSFAPEFEEIQQQVNSFLQFLSDPENNAIPAATNAPVASTNTSNNNSIASTEIASSYQSYQTSSQASIQIETRDGDIVTIDLSNSFSQQQSVGALQSSSQAGSFSGYVYEANSETTNSFSFTVSGSLDESELNAISNLVNDIGKTIGQFEKGDVGTALNIAKNINTQSEELSGFSFNVQTSEQYRAIDLYQKTQVATREPTASTGNTGVPITAPTTQPATAATTSAIGSEADKENKNAVFPNNISSIISRAKNSNILNAAATVNNIFEKFYEQLAAQREKTLALQDN